MKPSEIFEGENSSLKNTFDNAVKSSLKDFDEEYKKFLQCAKCDKVYDFSCPCQINRREFGKKLSLALDKQHKADMEEVKKIVEGIDDNGGGSGRRLKIQLLNKLKDV